MIKTDKIVYIYRHPLDVFLSYLNFASKNVNSKLGHETFNKTFRDKLITIGYPPD